jgi:HK97 family phage prohead protease
MQVMNRNLIQTRSLLSELKTRAEPSSNKKIIEGYFIVFNRETELWPGAFEEIAPQALDKTLGNDIRALINHDTTLVLGRSNKTTRTLTLTKDDKGLWSSIEVNEKDTDAMNLYERVNRGDVDQCSFGFNILAEETEWRDDGTVKWIITDIDLHEISVCTFPAYEETGVQARHAEVESRKKQVFEQRKIQVKERLRKCLNN